MYYGSEFGIEGRTERSSDDSLRPALNLEDYKDAVEKNPCTAIVAALGKVRQNTPALNYGSYAELMLTNRQYAFSRSTDGETLLTVINADANPFTFNLNMGGAKEDLLTGETMELGGLTLPGFTSAVFKV